MLSEPEAELEPGSGEVELLEAGGELSEDDAGGEDGVLELLDVGFGWLDDGGVVGVSSRGGLVGLLGGRLVPGGM